MRQVLSKVLLLFLFCLPVCAQPFNLQTQVKGLLPVSNAGLGVTPTGADLVPVSTSPSAIAFTALANCSGQALSYSTSTHTFTCIGTGLASGGNFSIQYANGSSPAGANFTGLVQNNGSTAPPSAATPAGVVAAQGYSYGMDGFGDSKQCSTGTSETVVGNIVTTAQQNGQWWQLQPIFGGDFTPYCESGDTSVDLNRWVFSHSYNYGIGSPNTTLEIYTNDVNNPNGATTNYQNTVKYGYQGSILFAAIPRGNKTFSQDAGVGTTGTWVPDTGYLYGLGSINTSGSGSISIPVNVGSDGHIILWSMAFQGGGGTYQLTVDGGSPLLDPVTASTTFQATGYGGTAFASQRTGFANIWLGYTFGGFSPGGHTITATVTSASGSSNPVEIGAAGGSQGTSSEGPYVFVSGVEYQNTGGASDTVTGIYNSIASGLVTNAFSSLNLPVYFEDTRSALLNSPLCGNGNEALMFSLCYADFLHQNNTGAAVIAQTYVATATAISPALTAGSLKDPRQGPSNQYNFLTAPADISHWWTPNGATLNNFSTGAIGFGIKLICVGGGQNCEGYGNLASLGSATLMGGGPYNIANCANGDTICSSSANLTTYLTFLPNGSACFFSAAFNTCNSGNEAYFAPGRIYLGGMPSFFAPSATMLTGDENGTATRTPATSSSNSNSPPFLWEANCWNGTATFPDDIGFQNFIANGSSPVSTLTFVYQYGCGGNKNINLSTANNLALPAATTINGSPACSPANGDCAITPTGTGFIHVTSGIEDGAARAVDLSSADATGILAAARAPAYTGDATSTAGTTALTLATVNGGPGSCGDAAHVCQVITNGKGQVTSQTAVAISAAGITALTGDVIASGPGSVAATLATVNGSPGSCGDSTHVCEVSTNAKGLVTSQSAVAIAGATGTHYSWSFTSCTLSGTPPQICQGSTNLPGAMPDASYQLICSAAGTAGISGTAAFATTNTIPFPTGSGSTINYTVEIAIASGSLSSATLIVSCDAFHN